MKTKLKDGRRDGSYVFLRSVPEAIKKNFKVACTRRGVTMREAFLEFMQEYPKR